MAWRCVTEEGMYSGSPILVRPTQITDKQNSREPIWKGWEEKASFDPKVIGLSSDKYLRSWHWELFLSTEPSSA